MNTNDNAWSCRAAAENPASWVYDLETPTGSGSVVVSRDSTPQGRFRGTYSVQWAMRKPGADWRTWGARFPSREVAHEFAAAKREIIAAALAPIAEAS